MKIFSLALIFLLSIACQKQVVVNSVLHTPGHSKIDQAYCSISQRSGGTLMSCPDGELHYLITAENDNDCEAFQLPIGVLYSCDNSEASIIENSFESRVLISQVYDPCGAQTINDELLLLLDDGRIFSFRESGASITFEQKFEGAHTTDDGSNCSYLINQDQQIIL
jgi:hypothetical protein